MKVVSISGTSRPDNYTSLALGVVNEELTRLGYAPEVLDGRELRLSFPDEPPTPDRERLISTVRGSSGVVLATPEYHGCFSAMTKLMVENMGFPSALAGKPVALLGVAAGRIGAIKSLEALRGVCAHVGAFVLPGAVSIAGVRQAFDEEGNCVDARARDALRGLAAALISYLDNFVCPRYVLEEVVRGEGKTWTSSL